jgi:hypothetical protein
MMLYYVMRPDNVTMPGAVFTRYGVLSKNRARSESRARACSGRLYATDGHNPVLVADFYQEPAPAPVLAGRTYWAARNQAAVFA